MEQFANRPRVKVLLIATSRSNFSKDLSEETLRDVGKECAVLGLPTVSCSTLVETEKDAMAALAFAEEQGCNALAVLLGNFGPEAPEAMLAQKFAGPVMYGAAADTLKENLYAGRRDAYCGLLNCSYNLNLRGCRAYIPENPVGNPAQIAKMIAEFIPIASAVIGLNGLKIITFGPRPSEFFACNSPIKGLYDLGVEIQENSELDLLIAYKKHAEDPRIKAIADDMASELGDTKYTDFLPKFAQYELTLLDWIVDNRGSREYIAFANKCWPAFQQEFGFLPCYVNSRLAAKGYPVGCETDVFGALSEFIGQCISGQPGVLLDINNNIPKDVFDELPPPSRYRPEELFIGFHCGNISSALLNTFELKYKMNRKEPYAPETGAELTRGTLEGPLKPGEVSCYRLHAAPNGDLQAYIAKGEILPITLPTYGSYAVFGIPEMARFYRHVLLEKAFPHHTAVLYGSHASSLYSVFRYLNIPYIGFNQPAAQRYQTENPF